MFSFFSKKTSPVLKKNYLWLRKSSMYEQLYQYLQKHKTTPHLLFTHFSHSTEELTFVLENTGIKLAIAPNHANWPHEASVLIAEATHLLTWPTGSFTEPIGLIGLEMHPLLSADQALLHHLKQVFLNSGEIQVWLDAENPVLNRFGMDRIKDVMGKMGAKADEYFTHSMIDRAIIQAQQKIEQNARQSKPYEQVRSCSEWLAKYQKG
jgi:hypothetical protein